MAPLHPEGLLILLWLQAQGCPPVFRKAYGSLPSLLGVGSSSKNADSSARVGKIPGSLSATLSSKASRMSSPLRHIRGSIHLWRSLTTLHSIPEGAPDLSTQYCRALASAKVSAFWVFLKFFTPWKSCCQEVLLTQTVNAKWGFPPTHYLFLNSGWPEGHGLLSGDLLHHVISKSIHEFFYKVT